MPIYDDLIAAAEECGDDAALEFAGRAHSYADVCDEARRITRGLRDRAIRPGDAVGIMLPNLPVFVSLAYGIFMNGSVLVPLSVLLKPRELAHIVADSGIQALIVFEAFLPTVEQALATMARPVRVIPVRAAPDAQGRVTELLEAEPADALEPLADDHHLLTLYTSGTTGSPKGAMISDANLRAQVRMIGSSLFPQRGVRGLCVLPLFHAYALNALLMMGVKYRVTIVLQARFDVQQCVEALATEKIEWFAGVPTMYAYILAYAESRPELEFPDLDVCLSGGAAMSLAVQRAFEQRFGAPIYEGYGLTETTVSVCSNDPGENGRKPGSVGRPYQGVEPRVVDDAGQDLPPGVPGELLFRGDNVMLGYLNQPEATAETIRDGWLHSGDIGYFDEDGFCFIVDRKKDVIIKSGYNIYPREVEEAIVRRPEVAEVAVVGVPDPVKGEIILAAVALKPDAVLTESELSAFLAEELSKYKLPGIYWFVPSVPKGPTGKILKREIRESWLRSKGSA
ncbi:MAG: AMP-binding protein [Acidobacteriota bacterium]